MRSNMFTVGLVDIPRYPSGISNSDTLDDIAKGQLTLHLFDHFAGVTGADSGSLFGLELKIDECRGRRHVRFNILVSWRRFEFSLLFSLEHLRH